MIYLDNNATTKVDPKVYVKQCEVLRNNYGNASSIYPMGIDAKTMIEEARKNVAAFINADLEAGDRIIFTSCATESNNAVFHSVLDQCAKGKRIVVSSVEHPSILRVARYYEIVGCTVVRIRVDNNGALDVDQLMESISEKTSLVSIGMVNSETGVINNIEHIVKKIKLKYPQILIHTDAVQAAGKIKIDTKLLDVDFLTLSGHKFHAPKGIGVLYIKKGITFVPLFLGGHQEGNLRAGTENTSSIVALGEAAKIAMCELNNEKNIQVKFLRDYMEQELKKNFPSSIIYGEKSLRVGNTTNIGFKNIDGSKLVLQLAQRGIFVSSGTACNSTSAEPSNVLKAMEAPKEYIRSIRISLSKDNTITDVQFLIKNLKELINRRNNYAY